VEGETETGCWEEEVEHFFLALQVFIGSTQFPGHETKKIPFQLPTPSCREVLASPSRDKFLYTEFPKKTGKGTVERGLEGKESGSLIPRLVRNQFPPIHDNREVKQGSCKG
jgi:hypothetical protein